MCFCLRACVRGGGHCKDKQREPYAFLKKRFLRFLPYSIFGFLFALTVKLILENADGGFTVKELLNWLVDGVWDVLMIKMNGMNDNAPLLNVPAWTLSAMLICEFLICACMYNNAKLFKDLVVPVTIIIGMGIWRHISGTAHTKWIGFTTFGLLRVWIIYCLSWYCCQLMLWVRNCPWTKTGVKVITVCEVMGYIFALLVMMNVSARIWRWVAILVIMFSVAISISGKSASISFFKERKWTKWMGELSMGIYLTHYPIKRVFEARYSVEEIAEHVLSFTLLVLIAAVVFMVVIDRAKILSSKLYQWTVKQLISEEATAL